MIFATFAIGTVLSAALFGVAVVTGDRAGMAWFGLGLVFFGYPTGRVCLWLLDHRFRLFGGRFAGPAAAPPFGPAVPTPRPPANRRLTRHRLLSALAEYVLGVTLAGVAMLLLGMMFAA